MEVGFDTKIAPDATTIEVPTTTPATVSRKVLAALRRGSVSGEMVWVSMGQLLTGFKLARASYRTVAETGPLHGTLGIINC